MNIVAHRGYWRSLQEKNTIRAIERAVANGFGIELDIRDLNRQIVVSHDLPNGCELPFCSYLERSGDDTMWAINVKSDGLSEGLIEVLSRFNIRNYFAFDMSIPEFVVYKSKGIRTYAHMSEIASVRVPSELSDGVWLDAFYSLWYNEQDLESLFKLKMPVCVVSEDLHGREYKNQWRVLKEFSNDDTIDLMLCTDYPDEARQYFYD